MFFKLFAILVSAALAGMLLLAVRQRHLETMHGMARLHATMDETRRQTWDLQVRISEQIEPETLGAALERNRLAVEPADSRPSGP